MKDSSATKPICLKVTPEFLKTIKRLMVSTSLSRSGVIKLAVSEMAERRLSEKKI